MDPTFLPLFGFLVGVLIGLTGVGGGAILAPILLIFFSIEVIAVIAIDLGFSFLTKLISIPFHVKKKTIDWKIVRRLWLGSLPASIFVIFLININPIFASEILKVALSCLIFISGMILIFRSKVNNFLYSINLNMGNHDNKTNFLTTFFGSFIGASVAATSVGAGAMGTAILSILYPKRLSAHRLVGTDIAHAIPVSLLAGLTYFAFGNLDLKVLFYLLLGSIPGVIIASKLIFNYPQDILRIIIGISLVISSLFLLFF